MKQQNSLEVPPQVRSASFDEMQLKPKAAPVPSSSLPAERQSFLLKVPHLGPKRSKSFDSGCDVDESVINRKRPPSLDKSNHYCVHCFYLEELERKAATGGTNTMDRQVSTTISVDLSSSSREEVDEDADIDDDSSNDELHEVICGIKVTLSPNSPSSASPTPEESPLLVPAPAAIPRTKPSSPKLERQPAIICPGGDLSSQENSFDTSDGGYSHHGSQLYLGSSSEYGDTDPSSSSYFVGGSEPTISRRTSIVNLRATRSADEYRSMSIQEQVEAEEREEKHSARQEGYLNVPTRRDRAASLDLAFAYPGDETPPTGLTRSISLEPPSTLRSKSIDIELPTVENSNYKVVVTSPKAIK